MMDLADIPDVAVSIITLLGSIATGLGTAWLFFRKRLRAWWKPYRNGIDAMAEIPALRHSVDAGRKETADVRTSVGMLSLMIRARGDINTETAEFEASTAGDYTYVNQTFARWLGVGKQELLDWKFMGFIHPDDRARVRQEWEFARSDHRVYNQRYRMVAVDGEEILVEVLITPIPEAPPAKSWIGVMRRIVT